MKRIMYVMILILCVVLVGCSNNTVSENEAKDIALKDAEVQEKDVTFLKTEVEDDEYKLIFQSETTLYEYEIDKSSGNIDSKKSAQLTPTTPSDNTNSQDVSHFITSDEAKEIAFKEFQVNENDVRNLDIEFENGYLTHYEIDFEIGKKEYSIKINAATKEILEKKID